MNPGGSDGSSSQFVVSFPDLYGIKVWKREDITSLRYDFTRVQLKTEQNKGASKPSRALTLESQSTSSFAPPKCRLGAMQNDVAHGPDHFGYVLVIRPKRPSSHAGSVAVAAALLILHVQTTKSDLTSGLKQMLSS